MGKENRKTNELAKLDVNNTTALMELLDKKLAEVKKVEDTPYKTNGDMSEHAFSNNIKNETESDVLVRMLSVAIAKEEAYQKAVKELNLSSCKAITFGTGTLDDLKHDIKLRIAIITQDTKSKALRDAKDKLSKFMTAEEQKTIILKDLAKQLAE